MAAVNRIASLIRSIGKLNRQRFVTSSQQHQALTTDGELTEYAVEMAASNIRYGPGVSQEVGMDFKNMNAKNVCLVTDKNISNLPFMKDILSALQKENVQFKVYDDTRVEPTNESLLRAIDFAKAGNFDAYLAVGGGSVIDTAKACNLYACNPQAELLDFVNAPIGKAQPVTGKLHPLIAVPTTAGTGSETTGVSIFDYIPLKAKTGIASRALKPTLGMVDPNLLKTMPNRVTCFSGFDVLCHALESLTAMPYNERKPRPSNPILRPAYQGSNPISDVWSKHALSMCRKYFKRAVYDADDTEARASMHLASAYAGIGFGNAGVHLCHGMSYPISGLVKSYKSPDYDQSKPLVPHGLSVIITAPAVFRFTAPACPQRHLDAAEILGADISNVKLEDAGTFLSDILLQYMHEMEIPNGISAFGYDSLDIPALVKGTLPQERVTKIAPRPHQEEDLARMLQESLTIY